MSATPRFMVLAALAALAGAPASPVLAQGGAELPVSYAEHDFSAVTMAEDLEVLVRQGALVPVLVVPPAFGGSEDALNTAWITPDAAAEKELIDDTLVDLAEQGLLNSFELEPEYRGESLVPTRITFRANHRGEGERFDLTVEVW